MTISTLGVGIETSTQNYKYTVPNTEEQLATEALTKRNLNLRIHSIPMLAWCSS